MLSGILNHAPWLAPLVVFGLVVFVHELGHFLAAKAIGVYAPRFSIGFGPSLFRKRWGETEYVLAALPLGGYVRMASREDEAVAFLEGGSEQQPRSAPHAEPHTVGASGAEKVLPSAPEEEPVRPKDWDPEALMPFGPKPVPEHRWFESKALPARLLILIAGVTMNAILALAINTGVFATYGLPYQPAVIDSVFPGRPASVAGFAKGDSIAAVNDTAVTRWSQVVERIRSSPGRPLVVDVVRTGGQRQRLTVTPELAPPNSPGVRDGDRVGLIGAGAAPREAREKVGFSRAASSGWNETVRMAGYVASVLRDLASRRVSVSQLGGPIEIARVSVEAARLGLEWLLRLIALLSINVAIFNLLPIPILDGGQILLNIAESVKGRPFSTRTREYILRFGLAAIALLFVTVMWNDITRLLGGLFN
ncbi:MAG TPA: site-2 protease family protein [Gemmatimonadaceae bacterium]|nr:site-2 protease family protein [Gemmatimonadaceae bacterium]